MRPVRIDQVIPTIVARDAVSSHTLVAQRVLRQIVPESEIYAQNIGVELRNQVRPVAELADDDSPGRWLLYQASIGSPVGDIFAAHPAPKLVNYHNITPAELIDWWEPHLHGELVLGREQLEVLAPLTTLGIAVSRYNEAELIGAGFKQTTVAPYMLDLSSDTEPDPGVLARLGAEREAGGKSWLVVGQLSPHKSQHDVIKALAFYRATYDPHARLHLIGRETSPRYAQSLRRLVAELDLGEVVIFEGAVSEAAKIAHYRGADVYVCCSEHEGFCAPLIESMHHGLPIVAYDAAAVGETVGDAGVVLASKRPSLVAAAVDRVLTDEALRNELVTAAQRRVREFDIGKARQRFAEAVRGAVEA